MKKISALVIDDNEDVLSVFRNLFLAEGVLCETACSGPEGLEKLGRGRCDIVFLDLVIPGIDGVTLAGILHKKYPGLHIVAMSAQDDDGVIRDVMEQGAKAYLVKPCSSAAILDCLRNVERHRTTDEVRGDLQHAEAPPPVV